MNGSVTPANALPQNDAGLFGAHVKALRLEHDLSQEDLAAQVQVSRESIRRIENGKGNTETLVSVLDALGVLDEVLQTLDNKVSRKAWNKARQGGRPSSRGGFSK